MACLPILFALAALARADSVLTLPGIEVRDARPIEDPALRRAPGFARAYDVTPLHGRVATVSDVLARAASVHVRQFGGIGSFSAVSIRGSSNAQVAYTLDGAPLNPPQYGTVNAGDLPLEALSRVEVYRGGAPLAVDAPGGGAVELVPRTDPGAWASADLGAGSFGTSKLDAAAGFARGRTSGLVVAQRLLTDGDFPYLDDNATDGNALDDTLKARANNAFDATALTARVAQGVGPVTVSALYDRLGKRQGVPGTGANPALFSSLASDRDLGSLRIATAVGALSLFHQATRDRFKDPAREITGSKQDNDDRTTMDGVRAEATRFGLSLLGEARRERYVPKINLPAPKVLAASERERVLYGAEQRLARGRFALVGQARRELSFDAFPRGPAYAGALPSPALARTTRLTRWSGGLRVELARGLSLRASVARLARLPTLEELFGNRGGVHGNRDARPERVLTRDAGFLYARGGFEAQLSAYRSDATDLLVWVQNSAKSSVAQNVDAARLEGVELSGRGSAHGVTLDLAWTRQWTRDQGIATYWRGNDLPGRPRDEASLGLAAARGPVRAFGSFHGTSRFFLDRYEQQRVPARGLVDLGAAFAFAQGTTELVAECRNLGDVHARDFIGYPLPGRTWMLGARFHFSPGKAGTP